MISRKSTLSIFGETEIYFVEHDRKQESIESVSLVTLY